MQDTPSATAQPLADLPKREWLVKLAEITRVHGIFQTLGDRHFAAFIEGEEDAETLIVTFESIQGIRALTEAAQPLGWDIAQSMGWAHLCIASNGDTWFRDENVFDQFDSLTDEGFFDAYDRIVFYGAGPCAYAAAAYSVCVPGSTVVLIQPQATLDPRIAGWDTRFVSQRKLDFTTRYGYAPDMIDAAQNAFVLFDPDIREDAMHAALFTKPHVTKLPLRHMGDAIQSDLVEMGILQRLLVKAATGKLDGPGFAQLYRKRRDYLPYLRRLMAALERKDRTGLAWVLATNVTGRMTAPRFQRRLAELDAALGKAPAAR